MFTAQTVTSLTETWQKELRITIEISVCSSCEGYFMTLIIRNIMQMFYGIL